MRKQAFLMQKFALDLTPMSDQDRVSPYNINTLSTRQVLRKKKKIRCWPLLGTKNFFYPPHPSYKLSPQNGLE